MKFRFINNAIRNITKSDKLTKEEIKSVEIGESLINITLKNGTIISRFYKLMD